MHTIELSHSIDAAHRVVGHEGGHGKCARLHGHTYHFVVKLTADVLTSEGFVVDFKVIKDLLNEWDHRTILWEDDPLWIVENSPLMASFPPEHDGVIRVPFNPTSENMAKYLADTYSMQLPTPHHVYVTVSETPKSRAFYEVWCNE